MAGGRRPGLLTRLRDLLVRPRPKLSERERAEALIRAIDAGGIPLHPGRVNQVARTLGLEVSRHAPVEVTIARIRAALARDAGRGTPG